MNNLVDLLRTPTGCNPPTKWELQAADRIEALELALRDAAAITPCSTDTADLRRQQQLRIQALGAALSRRDWHATEQAYNAIRDHFDRSPDAAATPREIERLDFSTAGVSPISQARTALPRPGARQMSDIVERLRSEAVNWSASCGHLFDEAADRIEVVEKALLMIADIGEGSTTANSLPHIARIARAAFAPEQDK